MHPVKRMKRIIAETEQMIRDVNWWNKYRTDAEPMDCEPERVLLPIAKACLRAWECGNTALAQQLSRKMVEVTKPTPTD